MLYTRPFNRFPGEVLADLHIGPATILREEIGNTWRNLAPRINLVAVVTPQNAA